MLGEILSAEDCAACRFCCSFRRRSLWETPLFSREQAAALARRFPGARFVPAGKESLTIRLDGTYATDDPEEEAPCPFLGEAGCLLGAGEKPFDCAVWPFRACAVDGRIRVALETCCPAVGALPPEAVRDFVAGGLGARIRSYAEGCPDALKEFRPGFILVDEGGAVPALS